MKYKIFHPPGTKIGYGEQIQQTIIHENCTANSFSMFVKVRRFLHRRIGIWVSREKGVIFTQWEMKEQK